MSVKKLHFAPPDHWVGDVHPIKTRGRWYLFYLRADPNQPERKFESSLAVSDDLVHWTPVTLKHLRPEVMHRNYYVVAPFWDHRAGVYRSFFGLESSVSQDLIHWDRAEDFRLPRLHDVYAEQRDPFVFWDDHAGCWRCVMTCGLHGFPREMCGTIGLFASADLREWRHEGPLLPGGLFPVIECPQMFRLGSRWYLLGAIGSPRGVGGFSYWMAETSTGPWEPTPRSLDGPDFCAPQVAADEQGRCLAFGWIPLASSAFQQHWGGHLALPREIFRFPEGDLGMGLEPSVARAIRGGCLWESGEPGLRTGGLDRPRLGGGGAVSPPMPSAGLIELSMTWPQSVGCAQVWFEHSNISVKIAASRLPGLLEVWAGTTRLAEASLLRALPREVQCLIVFEENLIEVFLAGSATLTARLPAPIAGSRIQWSAADGFPAPDIRVFEMGPPCSSPASSAAAEAKDRG